jgi:hypothetical protein
MVAIIKVLKRNDGYDKYFYPLATAWVCYQAQALISINQIGLAIWGWALTGAVIGYERATRERYDTLIVNSANTRKTKKSNDQSVSVYLTSVIGLAIGISISCPPFLADANWRTSMKSGNVELVQSAATNWPLDSYRLANVALVLEQNKFPQQAYEIAKELTLFNPNNYDGWKLLAGLSSPSQEEKINATNMMRKLDPRNLKLE